MNSFVWESKYLDKRTLKEFIALDTKDQMQLIGSTFSNYLKFGVNAGPKDEQLSKFVFEIDEALDTNEKTQISIASGHGTGKTFILSNLILYIGLTRKDAKIPTTAPVASQLENILIPEVKKWKDKLFPKIKNLVEVMTKDVKFKNGNKCFARTARKGNEEALAGVHATFVLYIIDEASGIDQKIFDVIEGALTGDNYLLVMCSNPTRTTGTFYDSHNKKKKFYRTIRLDSAKSGNVKEKWNKMMIEKYGAESDTVRVRVHGHFPKSSTNALFDIEMLEKFFDTKRDIDDSGHEVWGQDIARFGNDMCQTFKRKGYRGYGFEGWGKLDTMETAAKVTNIYNAAYNKPNYIFIDTIGVGAGVYDRLNQLGLSNVIIEANASFKATNNMYFNKRTEMYHNLVDAAKKGACCPYDAELEEELLAITYSLTPDGKIKLCPKDEIKEVIGRSPDKGDAVALSFFELLPAQEYKQKDFAQAEQQESIPQGAW